MENPFEIIETRLERIEEKLEYLIENITNTENTITWMTSKQLSAYLGISISTVTKFRVSKIPYYKMGGKILFKKQEIDKIIESTRHKTGNEYLHEYLNEK